jgi:hypothetical protein
MKLVEIEWEDAGARSLGPWVDKQEWDYIPFLVHEVGYVLHEDESGVILTSAYNDEQTGSVTQIPRKMIINIKVLHE